MAIEIRQDKRIKGIKAEFIRCIIHKCFDYLGCCQGGVSVYICCDETMKAINKEYRNIERPTDVLAFTLKDSHQPDYLGEIIISADAVRAQARRYKVSQRSEFVRLLIHGLLHLLGYNHVKNKVAAEKMFSLQEKLVDLVLGA